MQDRGSGLPLLPHPPPLVPLRKEWDVELRSANDGDDERLSSSNLLRDQLDADWSIGVLVRARIKKAAVRLITDKDRAPSWAISGGSLDPSFPLERIPR